ncbi:MAG TPA: DUF1028 domain-containing protein [Mycobacteriales bacterium]|jgi:uncharacterized Ntn-hydrolase superfamily protein|nr:DUF1028 domain-containing protein [Mycobacteriales bacterium]
MTFSIVAHDPDAGQLGVAVATCALAAGRAVPWAQAGVGVVTTQAQTNRTYGARGLQLMQSGLSPRDALDRLLAADRSPAQRQVAMVSATGEVAAWTGGFCLSACGHVTGKGFSAQGNTLASRSVVPSMAEAFTEASGPLADRLLAALLAAEEAGGDVRGRQSAALMIVDAEPTDEPWNAIPIDLRVDDHTDPIAELHRLLELQRAHEGGDWAALVDSAPADTRGLYVALDAVRRGDAAAARGALAELDDQPGMDAVMRRMRARTASIRDGSAPTGASRGGSAQGRAATNTPTNAPTPRTADSGGVAQPRRAAHAEMAD